MDRNTLFLLVYGTCFLLLGLVIVSVQYAPMFTLMILLICALVFMYVLTEHWKTHDAVEFENRFWTFTAGIVAWSCVFCSDSPFFIQERSWLAWFIVFCCSYGVHVYDRHLRRMVLRRIPKFPSRHTSHNHMDPTVRNKAKTLLEELRTYQERLDNKYISSFFQNIFNLGKVLHLEHEIINIFAKATQGELNIMMTTAELGLLFYKIKDHRIVRVFNRTRLLHLLCVERIQGMSVIAKAMLLDGIQKMKLSAHSNASEYVRSIILSTNGDMLSELKSLCDCKGDVNSFHKLIYRDLGNVEDRRIILRHIHEQARQQRAERKFLSPEHHRGKLAWKKVISDVDDTLTCSGGSWPAGMDASYPRKSVYPGVLAFYRELDLGFHFDHDESWDRTKHVGNLVFLSARPHVYKDVSEVQSYSKFRDLQEKRGLHTSPTLLAGSLAAGRQFMVGGEIEPVAEKKYSNLKEYLSLYPEYSCLYIGDNGQGDVRAAEMLLNGDIVPAPGRKDNNSDEMNQGETHSHDEIRNEHQIERCYIHQVQPLANTHTLHTETRTYASEKFCYFTTYVDAAIDAYEHHFISTRGLKNVMDEAVRDFHYIGMSDWKAAEESSLRLKVRESSHSSAAMSRWRRKKEKEREEESVSAAIRSESDIASDTGSDSSNTKTPSTTGLRTNRHNNNADKWRQKSTIVQVYNPESKIDARIRELNNSLRRANKFLETGKYGTVALLTYKQRYPRGSLVKSAYGMGVVQRFRGNDGIYEVIVQWDATGSTQPCTLFLQGSAIKSVPLTLHVRRQVRRFRSSASQVQVSLPSAVPKIDLTWDHREKKEKESGSIYSNRSSPATVSTLGTNTTTEASTNPTLTLAAVARHNIMASGKGKKEIQSKEDANSSISSTTSTINRMNPSEVPLDKALEMAFLPSALARSSRGVGAAGAILAGAGATLTNSQSFGGGGARARTTSETSDDMLSLSHFGDVVGRYRSMHPDDHLEEIRGAQVWTPYGLGYVEDYRIKDDVVVVQLLWGARIFAMRGSVVQLTDPQNTRAYQIKLAKQLDVPTNESVLLQEEGGNLEPPPKIVPDPPTRLRDEGTAGEGSGRKPSLLPAWLGFWQGDEPPSISTPSLAPLANKNASLSLSSTRHNVSTRVSGLLGLDVRTFAGMGVIERIFKDEDEPDEGGFVSPPVFIVEVRLQGARGYLTLDNVWMSNRVYRDMEKGSTNNLLESIKEDHDEDGDNLEFARPLSSLEEVFANL